MWVLAIFPFLLVLGTHAMKEGYFSRSPTAWRGCRRHDAAIFWIRVAGCSAQSMAVDV